MNRKFLIISLFVFIFYTPIIFDLTSDTPKEIGSYSTECYYNDFPQEDLNGLTLREVFEDGNLVPQGNPLSDSLDSNGLADGFVTIGSPTYFFSNGIQQLENISGLMSYMQNDNTLNLNTINKYFYAIEAKGNIYIPSFVNFSGNLMTHALQGDGSWEIITRFDYLNYDSDVSSKFRLGMSSANYIVSIKSFIFLDTSSLGISPTTDMDYYYYQYRKDFKIPCPYIEKTDNINDIDGYDLGFKKVEELYKGLSNPVSLLTNIVGKSLTYGISIIVNFGELAWKLITNQSEEINSVVLGYSYDYYKIAEFEKNLVNGIYYKSFEMGGDTWYIYFNNDEYSNTSEGTGVQYGYYLSRYSTTALFYREYLKSPQSFTYLRDGMIYEYFTNYLEGSS